jgi:hypothetical protein
MLLQAITDDAKGTQHAAERLYVKNAEFAHVLDPSVVPPPPSWQKYE